MEGVPVDIIGDADGLDVGEPLYNILIYRHEMFEYWNKKLSKESELTGVLEGFLVGFIVGAALGEAEGLDEGDVLYSILI